MEKFIEIKPVGHSSYRFLGAMLASDCWLALASKRGTNRSATTFEVFPQLTRQRAQLCDEAVDSGHLSQIKH